MTEFYSMNLPGSVIQKLEGVGILDCSTLTMLSATDILHIKGIGLVALKQIEDALEKVNLKLAESNSDLDARTTYALIEAYRLRLAYKEDMDDGVQEFHNWIAVKAVVKAALNVKMH